MKISCGSIIRIHRNGLQTPPERVETAEARVETAEARAETAEAHAQQESTARKIAEAALAEALAELKHLQSEKND